MEVFEYKANELFEVKASTNEVLSPWKKFRARILHPYEYCSYGSNVDGELSLFDYEQGKCVEVAKDDMGATRPVFFETNSYSFTVFFPNIEEGTEPHIIHPDKRVSEMFNCQSFGSKAFLSGSINFLNEPGRFCLKFSFTPAGSTTERIAEIDFDVVSPKLDTKEDLKSIIRDIRAEYDDLVFRYLSLTYQQFAAGREANNDVIWLAVFKQIVQGYLSAVRYIVHRPHFRNIHKTEYLHAERIKRWTPALAERFVNDYLEDKDESLRKLYRYQQTETTEDTRENRFVKYTIGRISERLQRIMRRIIIANDENVSVEERAELENYVRALDKLSRNTLFKNVGRFDGFRQESIVLQQRTGYAQVYRYWLILQNGLDLIDGRTSVGVLPIWQLYELWCFLKLKKITCEALNLDVHNPEDKKYIFENASTMFNPFQDSEVSDSVTYINRKNGDSIEVGYQYCYTSKNEMDGVHSATVEQKPDIVMNVHKHNPDITLTYLFDAKYRVQGDDDPNVSDSVKDYPVQDTLNQMHRYRDAIYYGDRKRKNMSKEVIGAYILFPGRLDERKLLDIVNAQDWDNKDIPYYIRSIHQVNIGAYPLLPNDDSGFLLKNQIFQIIRKESVSEQLVDSIPQRGLYYTEANPMSKDIILFGCVRDDAQWEWIKENQWYNVRVQVNRHEREGGLQISQDLLNAHHFVLYRFTNSEETEVEVLGVYDVEHDDEIPSLFDGMEMNSPSVGYPRKVDIFYRYLIYQLDFSKPTIITTDREKLRNMIELMQKKYTVGKDKGTVEIMGMDEFVREHPLD